MGVPPPVKPPAPLSSRSTSAPASPKSRVSRGVETVSAPGVMVMAACAVAGSPARNARRTAATDARIAFIVYMERTSPAKPRGIWVSGIPVPDVTVTSDPGMPDTLPLPVSCRRLEARTGPGSGARDPAHGAGPGAGHLRARARGSAGRDPRARDRAWGVVRVYGRRARRARPGRITTLDRAQLVCDPPPEEQGFGKLPELKRYVRFERPPDSSYVWWLAKGSREALRRERQRRAVLRLLRPRRRPRLHDRRAVRVPRREAPARGTRGSCSTTSTGPTS